ncbi:MAG: glycosyltransferase [Clostridia bacterium]|nr:glycosyltransferase [Clostridia bacterium]
MSEQSIGKTESSSFRRAAARVYHTLKDPGYYKPKYKILIVSDSFSKGGLETHIYSLYSKLKEDHDFYFAFNSFDSSFDIPSDRIYTGFHFGWNESTDEFCEDVDRLVQIVECFGIDVINVHPFYAIFPSIFASNITRTKLVYTYHGIISANFTQLINDTVLFEYAFESSVGKVLAVSRSGIDTFKTFNYHNVVLFPNGIDSSLYVESRINFNKTWCIFSRLDQDNAADIKRFFEYLPKLEIDKIDIYGDGSYRETLESYVKEHGLNVEFLGYSDKLFEVLKDKYTGCIGISRSAMEGVCMNYPVILIGRGKVVGAIDDEIFDAARDYNFVPENLPEISSERLAAQVKEINSGSVRKYRHRSKFIRDHDILQIADRYIDELSDIRMIPQTNLVRMYEEIEKMRGTEDGYFKFFYSRKVYDLLKKYVEWYSGNVFIKNLFAVKNMMNNVEDGMGYQYYALRDEIRKKDEEINALKKELEEISKKNES